MKMKKHLEEKENEVDSLKKRLATMSKRRVNQDQRMTENTLSSNMQSELERDYVVTFKDGERVDAIDIITKKLSKSFKTATNQATQDHLKASRLACLIFEVHVPMLMSRNLLFHDR